MFELMILAFAKKCKGPLIFVLLLNILQHMQPFCENDQNYYKKFTMSTTKHLKHNKNYIEIPRPPNDLVPSQRAADALLLPPSYLSRLDLVNDSREVFVHLPLRSGDPTP